MRDVLDVLAGRGEWAVACGDAAASLAQMPAGCIHVCTTSPPYYALRDYGTGRWEGGEAGCDHKESSDSRTAASTASSTLDGGKGNTHRSHAFRSVCGKCGARRVDAQIGLEATLGEYLSRLAGVFDEVKRVLRDDGLLALNVGDSYSGDAVGNNNGRGASGLKNDGRSEESRQRSNAVQAANMAGMDFRKRVPDGLAPGNLLGVPWRLALLLQERGWVWRSTVVWRKLSPMPASLNGWRWQRCRVKVRNIPPEEQVGGFVGAFHQGGRAANMGRGSDHREVEWRDCPGCPRCEPHGGLVLRKGSWRPTCTWEPVFLFAKSMSYSADGEPVKQTGKNPADDLRRINADRAKKYSQASQEARPSGAMRGDLFDEAPAGANLRDYWDDVDDEPDEDNMPDVLELGPEPLAEQHYAAFPTRLVSRILRFAASERGVCGACGAPWARITSQRFINNRGNSTKGGRKGTDESNGWDQEPCGFNEVTTLGWRPTCTCPDPSPVGAVVLDPFAGSGSAGVAARRLGLRFVGLDLSEPYCRMARRRIGAALREGKRAKARKGGEPTLFDQEGTP